MPHHRIRSTEQLNNQFITCLTVAQTKADEALMEVDCPFWVDVRDVAKAHVEALVRPAANGERFILAPHKATYASIAELLRERLGLVCSRVGQELEAWDIEAWNCGEVLGMEEWVAFEDMVCETVRQVMN